MIVVGVTGKYCAGKSTVAEVLKQHGYSDIDVDQLGHHALIAEQHRVVARFGAGILGASGEIDRGALGRVVFADPTALADLEAIVHPAMVRTVEQRIDEFRSQTPVPNVCLSAAILFKMGLDRLCDTIVWVDAPVLQRLRRARNRDRLGWGDLLRRVFAQRNLRPPHRSLRVENGNAQQSDHRAEILTVRNDGSRDALVRQLSTLVPLE